MRSFPFLGLMFLMMNSFAFAQTPSRNALRINWYKPVFQNGAPTGKVRSVLSGRTMPGSQINIAVEEISVLQANGDVSTVKSAEMKTTDEPVQADANGYFEMTLDLPQGGVQLPIKIASATEAKSYQINLQVQERKIEMKSKSALQSSPALANRPSVWAGLGYNYVNLKQQSAEANVDVAFESFRAPSVFFEVYYPLASEWGAFASYKKSPGAVGSPEGTTVQNGSYSWDTSTVEGKFAKPSWKKSFWKRPAKLSLRFGASQHTVPFWTRTSTTTVDILTNTVLMASVGPQLDYDLSEKWVLTSLVRLQQPLSSGSLFSVKSPFSFDGSVGAYYRFTGRFSLGGFWYGQFSSWNFSHQDLPLAKEVSGSQSLLYSNMEVRAGYAF